MEVLTFSEIETEFLARIQSAVYCSMVTVDRQSRPRSRIIHPIWDGSVGWLISWPGSHKAKHLSRNPYVSLAYIQDSQKPVYVDAYAEWVNDPNEKQRVWNLHQTTAPPMGFDPGPHYGNIHHRYFGLLKLTPWRIELAHLNQESLIWRQNPKIWVGNADNRIA